jgi:hypothetical protein
VAIFLGLKHIYCNFAAVKEPNRPDANQSYAQPLYKNTYNPKQKNLAKL